MDINSVENLAKLGMGFWNSCVSALRNPTNIDPSNEKASTQNCWSWSLKKWLFTKKGALVITYGPRNVLRCMWAPEGDAGPLWHFEPLFPKRGLKGIWHSFFHLGKPTNVRE